MAYYFGFLGAVNIVGVFEIWKTYNEVRNNAQFSTN